MTDTPFNRKIQDFFADYIVCNPVAIGENRMLRDEAVKEAAKLLIQDKVFSSVRDIRLQALKDYNIFLPAWVFEWVKGSET